MTTQTSAERQLLAAKLETIEIGSEIFRALVAGDREMLDSTLSDCPRRSWRPVARP